MNFQRVAPSGGGSQVLEASTWIDSNPQQPESQSGTLPFQPRQVTMSNKGDGHLPPREYRLECRRGRAQNWV